MFDNKESLLEVVRLYHIRRYRKYKIETSNQIIIALKCKRGCTRRLRTKKNTYSSAWHIVTYKWKHGSCVLGSNNMLVRHIHFTSSVFNNLIRSSVSQDLFTIVFMV